MIIAKTSHIHFAPELLKVENVHRAKTAQIDKMTNCIKLTENHKIEKATHAKNHFFMC